MVKDVHVLLRVLLVIVIHMVIITLYMWAQVD